MKWLKTDSSMGFSPWLQSGFMTFKYGNPYNIMDFESAPDIQERVVEIIRKLELSHVRPENIICMRSYNSKAKAYARIWSLPRIWQKALGVEAHYILEVLSHYFDKRAKDDQDRTLIHELMHVPKTFSGALVPHKCFEKRIDPRSVEVLFRKLKDN